jgi:hypothetical protein
MMHLRKLLPGLAAVGLLLGSSGMVHAGIIFDVFPYRGSASGQNVLFNASGLIRSGTTVEGKTNRSNTVISFSSLGGELLETPSGGQARLDGKNDGKINRDFKINAKNTEFGFDSIFFKVNSPNQQSPRFQVIVEDFDGRIYRSSVLSGQNGAPAFSVRSTNGQLIKSLTFDLRSGSLDDIRQVRLGVRAVPEASTVLSFAGLLCAGGLILKRARKQT